MQQLVYTLSDYFPCLGPRPASPPSPPSPPSWSLSPFSRTNKWKNTSGNTEHKWWHLLALNNISLLVLNRGAHYEEDTKLLQDLNATMQFVITNHPHISIVWRNTPFGNRQYDKFVMAPPHQEPPNLPPNAPYHYAYFKHQNQLVRKLIRTHFPTVLILDVFRPTVLRSDSHFDALHLCIPGIMDTWLLLLYNAFLRIEQYGKRVRWEFIPLVTDGYIFVCCSKITRRAFDKKCVLDNVLMVMWWCCWNCWSGLLLLILCCFY